ncbi:hypothetical protein SUDANB51_00165 [Streptomyces sp. enrichment culture]
MALTGRQRPPSEHAFSPHDAVLRTAAPHVARRRFLTVTAAAAMPAFATNRPTRGATAAPELDAARVTDDPFTLGVASGDPLPDSVLIWTRLAPEPFAEDGGLGQQRVVVYWEVAMDEWFAFVEHRCRHRPPRVRAQRARRRQGPDAGQRVLLPVPGGGLDQPRRPHPDGTGRGQRHRRHAAGRGRLPGLPGRLPHRPPASGAGGRRRGLPPRRLPVRVRGGLRRRGPPLHRPQAARRVPPRGDDAGGLPAAVRAVQERPGPAGRARPAPGRRHLGRPRDREQLRGRRRREGQPPGALTGDAQERWLLDGWRPRRRCGT